MPLKEAIQWAGALGGVGKFKGEFWERTNEASCRLVVALPQMQIRSKTKKEQRLNRVKTNGLVGTAGVGGGETLASANRTHVQLIRS